MATSPYTTFCISAPMGTLAGQFAAIIDYATNLNKTLPDFRATESLWSESCHEYPDTQFWEPQIYGKNAVVYSNTDPISLRSIFDSKLASGPTLGAGTDTKHILVESDNDHTQHLGYNAVFNELWAKTQDMTALQSKLSFFFDQAQSIAPMTGVHEEITEETWAGWFAHPMRDDQPMVRVLTGIVGKSPYCKLDNANPDADLAREIPNLLTIHFLDYTREENVPSIVPALVDFLGSRMIITEKQLKEALLSLATSYRTL